MRRELPCAWNEVPRMCHAVRKRMPRIRNSCFKRMSSVRYRAM
ncbi:hypothetical protein [Numidum massiliense]|nr:hypothetical protein [Numidum massiliense]